MNSGDGRFIELYERFYAPVYSYCRRRTNIEAVDDVVADTFLVAWRKVDAIPTGSAALPWLYGVAYKVLSHQWRGLARRQRLERKLAGMNGLAPSMPDEVIVARQESSHILQALSDLRPADQELLRLTAWEELTPKELAIALEITPGAARQRLHEARKRLAKSLERIESRNRDAAGKRGGSW